MSAAASPSAFSLPFPQTSQAPVVMPKSVHGATPAQLKKIAKDFETSMVSALLQPMFSGLSTAPPFGGGEAEGTFRSFLVDAMAKKVVGNGGLNLSDSIERELVRMQGAAS